MMGLTGIQWVLAVVALFALVFGPSGAAAVAVKAVLNGAREDIRKTAATCERMDKKLGEHGELLARVDERTKDHDRRIGNLEDAV